MFVFDGQLRFKASYVEGVDKTYPPNPTLDMPRHRNTNSQLYVYYKTDEDGLQTICIHLHYWYEHGDLPARGSIATLLIYHEGKTYTVPARRPINVFHKLWTSLGLIYIGQFKIPDYGGKRAIQFTKKFKQKQVVVYEPYRAQNAKLLPKRSF
jgi:hypothetical protein